MSNVPAHGEAKPASRRRFLKQSGAAVAGVGAGATLLGSLAARTYAQSDETIRIALVGCGGRGSGAANDALKTSGPTKLVAMADAFGDRLETSRQGLAAAHGDKVDVPPDRRFVGLDAYQKAIDTLEDQDVVILATPPGWRPVHFEYAVSQNRNIFMEKPVATDAPGIRRVLAAAEEAKAKNLKVGVGLQRHHQLPYQQCIQRIHDGQIGDIVSMHVYWNGSGVWTRPRRPGMTEMAYQTLNWYYFNWLCGDHIVEQHIHNLDVGNWVKGFQYPVACQGMGGRQVRTGNQNGQIFDHHAVEYIYADGTRMYSYCRHIPGCWNQVAEFAHGTKGAAAVNGTLFNDQAMRDFKWRFEGDYKNPYEVEHDVLFDAVRNDSPHMEAEYGAKSTFTAILGRMATYSGKMVRWDRALQRGKELAPGIDGYTMSTTPPVTPDPSGAYPVPVPGKYDPLA